jgi:hypothetical protein
MNAKATTAIVALVDFCRGLGGKPSLQISIGAETRLDNLQVAKEFFYVEVLNDRSAPAIVEDIALIYRNPSRSRTVKTVIVAERRDYPVTLPPRSAFRIHLLPGLIDFSRLDSVNVKVAGGKQFRQPVLLPAQCA